MSSVSETMLPVEASRRTRVMQILAQTAVSIFAVLLFVPFSHSARSFPSIDSMSVDEAFIVALPKLFVDGAEYGPDVVFTYGPWGFVTNDIGPFHVYLLTLAFRVLFALLLVQAFWDLARTRNRWQTGTLAVCAVGLGWLWFRGPDQGFWFVPSLYLLVRHAVAEDRDRSFRGLALGCLVAFIAGWSGLVKFNLLVFSGIVIAAATFNDLRLRRFPIISAVWLTGLLTGWLTAGQKLANFPVWVSRSLDLSTGYSEAMARGFTSYSWPKTAAFYSGILAIMLFAVVAASICKSRWSGLSLVGVMALFCYSALQHAMGGNQLEQANVELLTALWFLMAFVVRNSQGLNFGKWRTSASFGLIAFAVVINLAIVQETLHYFGPARSVGAVVKSQFQSARQLAFGDRTSREQYWDNLLASIAESMPVPADVAGRADVYPQHTGMVIADPKLVYSPRPAYLSLNAHTKKLVELNAEHLRTNGPDVALFQVLTPARSVHHRHPATDDGPSWPELLTRYRLTDWTTGNSPNSEFLVLKRRERPLAYRFDAILEQDVAWNEFVAVPQDKLVWLAIEARYSNKGRIVKPTYKSPRIEIELFDGDSIVDRYQIVPGLGRAGFLVSPHVDTTERFASLFNDESVSSAVKKRPVQDRKRITKFRLQTESGTEWFWKKLVRVRLAELVISNPEVEFVAERP